MRAFVLAIALIVLPLASPVLAQEKPTLAQVHQTLDSINKALGALNSPTREMRPSYDVSEDEVVDYVERIKLSRTIGQRAIQSLTFIRDRKLLKPGGEGWNLKNVDQLMRNATFHLETATNSATITARELAPELERLYDNVAGIVALDDGVRTYLADEENLASALENLEKTRKGYRRAIILQEGFGADASDTRQVLAVLDQTVEKLPAIHAAALAGAGLPEPKSDDPEMMAAAEQALERWKKRYKHEETGPIVLTSEAITKDSRNEIGVKAGGDTNTKLEAKSFVWREFVFWVPVRAGDDWHLYRMVARSYVSGPGKKLGHWYVWNDGKMNAILPSAWEN